MSNDLDFMDCPTCHVPPIAGDVSKDTVSETPTANILFTTHCPMCRMVTMALDRLHVPYRTVDDIQEILTREFTSMPMFYLASEDRIMDARETLAWVNQQGGEV